MTLQTILILLLVGLLAGVLSGMVGVGGGLIIVPALVFILGYSQLQAQGTSLGVLLLPAGLLAVINYYQKGYVDLKVVLILAAGFLVGGWLGSKISLSMPETIVKKIFAAFMILAGIKMLFIDK